MISRRMLFTVLGACLGGMVQAVHACGSYTVGMYEHGALYYPKADGGWSGIDLDIIDELARRTGCTLRPRTESRIRIWTMLQQGTMDMSVSGIATPERSVYAQFIPYLNTRNFVLLRQDAAQVTSKDDFLAHPALTVAVIKSFKHGDLYDAWLDKLRAQGRVYETPDYSSLLRLFRNGRVDAILVLNTNWTGALRHELETKPVRVMDWAARESVTGGLVISRRNVPPEVYQQLRQAMQAMRGDGTLKAIYERHVPADVAAGMMLPASIPP